MGRDCYYIFVNDPEEKYDLIDMEDICTLGPTSIRNNEKIPSGCFSKEKIKEKVKELMDDDTDEGQCAMVDLVILLYMMGEENKEYIIIKRC